MNCETVRKNASLFLYGELSLEEDQSLQDHIEACEACRQALQAERRMHATLDEHLLEPDAALLARCRRDLGAQLELARPRRGDLRSWFSGLLDLRLAALAKPAGALALVAIGFFAARWTAAPGGLRVTGTDPVATRVRFLQPEASGQVRLVVEETRQRMLSGNSNDQQIQRLLLAAAREASDPGVRADSMGLLEKRDAASLRPVLIDRLEHDSNPGVRLKALEGLKPYATEEQVRSVLAKVLLSDDNPGVRAQAIDLLVEQNEDSTVGLLQKLVQKDSSGYVRLRCQKALDEMNASVGTF